MGNAQFNNIARQKRTYLEAQLKKLSQVGISMGVQFSVNSMIAQISKSAEIATVDAMDDLANSYATILRSRRRNLQKANEAIAQEALKAIVQARQVADLGHPDYRSGDLGKTKRFSGGVLDRALGSSQMFIASPNGVAFGNSQLLDREAKQWFRLNYGHGGGSRTPRTFPVVLFEQEVSRISDKTTGHASGFLMPAGFFNSGDRRFYLAGESDHRTDDSAIVDQGTSATITGQRFLDAGLEVVARGVPAAAERATIEAFREAVNSNNTRGVVAAKAFNLAELESSLDYAERNMTRLVRAYGRDLSALGRQLDGIFKL